VSGNLQGVQELIDNGVSVNVADWQQQTPLHKASLSGQANVVTLLVQAGADIDAKDSQKMTALHCAASRGWTTIVHFLVKWNADKEAEEKTGKTALFLAASCGRLEVVQYLAGAGANKQKKDRNGITPSLIATENGFHEVARFLSAPGVPVRRFVSAPARHSADKLASMSNFSASTDDSKRRVALHPKDDGLATPACHKPQCMQGYLWQHNGDGIWNGDIAQSSIEFGSHIGHGLFGHVYGAQMNGKRVAVKEFNITMLSARDDIARLSKCRHKHIVNLLGMCSEPMSIVMEYCAANLFHQLHGEKHVLINTHQMLSGIASGLAYLHRIQVCHEDLKSENVLIEEPSQIPKICDYGFASLRNLSHTFSGVREKTRSICYRAPEVLSERPRFTALSDVFAFGMLAWEICSQKVPYERWSSLDIIWHTEEGNREKIQKVPNMHMRLLIQRAWTQDPSLRPAMEDLLMDLSKIWWGSMCQLYPDNV
jgi:hypothetical protein